MKKLFSLLLFAVFAFCGMAIAQEVGVEPVPEASFDEFFSLLWKSLDELKGAGILTSVTIITQLVMKLVQTKAGELLGKYKLLLVSLLTLILGVTGLMTQSGMDLVTALLHSSTFTAAQVFIHQLYKQFFEKED